ncbi:MAG TPA: M56 family metallopeptidase [Clostridia bacterium]|nr:M56 family metallopeptidase [Clostridia bacterium]
MTEWIGRILTMSAQAGVLILCLALLRLAFKKHGSPRLRYGLWLLPAIRLLLPFSVQSALSLMNFVPQNAGSAAFPSVTGGMPVINAAPFPVTPVTPTPAPETGMPVIAVQPAAQAAPSLMTVLFWVWAVGAALTLFYMFFINLRFYRRVKNTRLPLSCTAELPVYLVPGLNSPCLFGYFRPVILVNDAAKCSEETLSFVLKHELCHHRAGDSWWALIRNLCLILHWFNPLVWWAAFLSRADCELACDARVMKGFSQSEREHYGMALLSTLKKSGAKTSLVNATTSMTGSKRELRERIVHIAKRPKTLWIAVAALALCALIAAISACTEAVTETEPPVQTITAPSPMPDVQAAQTDTPSFDLQNAAVHELNYQYEMLSTPGMVREETLSRGTRLTCTYEQNGDDEASHLFVNGTEALTCAWAWNMRAGEYDLTGDGRNELILFVRPEMSNFVSGDLHVYDLGGANGQIKEILTLRGEPAFGDAPTLPAADGDTYMVLPNGFSYTENSGWNDYSKMLEGASVLEADGAFCLRLWHESNELETAYTYLAWENGWRVMKQEIVSASERALAIEEQYRLRRTLTGDFDGDKLEDTALLEGYGQNNDTVTPHATLTVYLGNGENITYSFSGELWDADSLYGGDFDGDKIDDIAVFLEYFGTTYGAGIVHVLKVENGALTEFPYTVNGNSDLPYVQSENILDGAIGITVLPGPGKDTLRIQSPLDVKYFVTAQYIDLAFNGKAWDTIDITLGVAYGNEFLPDTPLVPEINAVHRAGYTEAKLTFLGSNTLDAQKPDKRYYEWDFGRFSPTANETAQTALRVLYDMTGVQVESCYFSGTWSNVTFSTSKSTKTEFFRFGYGRTSDGSLLYIMTLNYKGKHFPNSPIDPATMVKPSGYETMTEAELARWYYDNSSYGDRRPIVRAEDGLAGLNLVLNTGEFYEIGFGEESRFPNSFYGPYAKGFTH